VLLGGVLEERHQQVAVGRRRRERRAAPGELGGERRRVLGRSAVSPACSTTAWRIDSRRQGRARGIASPFQVISSPPHDLGDQGREHLLDELHQRLVVDVGPVELEHRELGVVAGRDALVAEVAVDLVDPRQAADQQPLQEELGAIRR
jgi:hypothetical protein